MKLGKILRNTAKVVAGAAKVAAPVVGTLVDENIGKALKDGGTVLDNEIRGRKIRVLGSSTCGAGASTDLDAAPGKQE